MDAVQAYIPIDRRLAMAAGRSLPEWTEGAALFADISGFTPLTEMLARALGARRGAEEMTRTLNQVYDALIGALYRYGGSVIGFSGDAITCWLDGDDGMRATAAALAMQEAMGRFARVQVPGAGEVSLAMKAAVTAGPARRFVVGNPDYLRLDVMAGATLVRLAAAEHQAERGEVILDGESAAALPDLVVREWRVDESDGSRYAVVAGLGGPVAESPWLEGPTPSTDASWGRSWLLPPVYRRLQAGQGDFLAELRPATALFLRFGGIDYDLDPEAPTRLDRFIHEVQAILTRFEGSLIQLTIGDKGSYLYCAFGAPVAHEDDVARAALAALAFAALPDRLTYLEPLQIGITHGRMRVGAYGGTLRRTYGVLGDAVNLSARLMSAAAPGQILADDGAHARAGGALLWERLPAVRVKGKSEPVALHRLVRARRRSHSLLQTLFPTPPIGRKTIFAALDRSLQRLMAGQGTVVRLVAEAGMGKSHVAAEFARRALLHAPRLAVGHCQSVTRSTPYHPWRQLLSTLLELDEVEPEQMVPRLTERLVAMEPAWRLRLPLLGDLTGLSIPDNATTAGLERDVRQEALFSLVIELLRRLAREQPLVLVIENGQWADESSLALLRRVAQQGAGMAPLMILLLHRLHWPEGSEVTTALEALPFHQRLDLGEMTEAEMEALIARRLGGPPSPLLSALVRQVARSNPFFAGELVDSMQQAGQLDRDDAGGWRVAAPLLQRLQRADFVLNRAGRWELKADAGLAGVELGLPDSIHGLLLSRLDRLPDRQKMTLKVCSVLGEVIDLPLVAASHPERPPLEEISRDAAALEAATILQAVPESDGRYAFRQHATREVTYEMLLHAQRQQLHGAVAAAMATHQPDAAPQIAHHAFLGQRWSLALPASRTAGRQAAQLHANLQAIDFYRKGLHSAARLPESETREARKALHLALGELLVTTAAYDEAESQLTEAIALAAALSDHEAEGRGHRWVARSLENRGSYQEALQRLERADAVLAGVTSAEVAESALLAGLIQVRQGEFEKAMALCHRSLKVGDALDATAIRARTYNLMGIIELRSKSSSAIERFAQSLAQYEQLGDIYGQATSHNLIANGHFADGTLARADYHYRRALDLFTQTGNLYNQVVVNNNLGGIALKQGRLDAALDYYRNAATRFEELAGATWVRGALHLNVGNCHIQLGAYDAAEKELVAAGQCFEEAVGRDLLPELYWLWAELNWKRGDAAAAVRDAERSIALSRELDMPRDRTHALRILAEVALDQGALDRAASHLDEGEQLARETGDAHGRARLMLCRAALLIAQECGMEAGRLLDEADAILQEMDAGLDLARLARLRRQIGAAA